MKADILVFLTIIMIFRGSFLKRRHGFKAFFWRLFNELFSEYGCLSESTICPFYVLHAVAAAFRADTDIDFPDCF